MTNAVGPHVALRAVADTITGREGKTAVRPATVHIVAEAQARQGVVFGLDDKGLIGGVAGQQIVRGRPRGAVAAVVVELDLRQRIGGAPGHGGTSTGLRVEGGG